MKQKKTPKAAGGGRGRHQALAGGTRNYPRDRAVKQCDRLWNYLTRHDGATVGDCRSKLRILSPPARIMELRDAGWPIVTVWERVIDRAGVEHRIGRYVLMAGAWEGRT